MCIYSLGIMRSCVYFRVVFMGFCFGHQGMEGLRNLGAQKYTYATRQFLEIKPTALCSIPIFPDFIRFLFRPEQPYLAQTYFVPTTTKKGLSVPLLRKARTYHGSIEYTTREHDN